MRRGGRSRKHICMGAPPLLWGRGIKRAMGTRPRAEGSEGSVWASPPWPGLCSSSASSLRAQVRPPGKEPGT